MELTPIKKHVDNLQKAIEEGRESRIGGSDVGAIMGANPYKSAYTLWAEKCGFIEPWKPSPDNERIRLGHDLEQYTAERWMEATGKKCRNDNSEYSLAEYPFMVGHIDRRVVGEAAGLEIKTTGEFNRTDFANDEIEPQWYAQCVFYMAVTGLSKWYLAVLQFGRGFHCFEINRDEREIENVVNTCAAFWAQVEAKAAPLIDGSDSTSDTIAERWHDSGDDYVADLTSLEPQFMERLEIEDSIKRLTEQKDKIDNQIKAALNERQTGRTALWKATWKPTSRTTIDSKRLKAERPDIFEEYSKTTETRTLKIAKITEKKERKNK